MRTPKIDLKELEEMKKENFKERLEFVEMHAGWVKKHSNRKWSSEQKDIISD